MSFNFLEVAKAAGVVESELHRLDTIDRSVRAIELVEFPLSKSKAGLLPDLNVAIRLSTKTLVFSLRAPWVGVYFLDSKYWRTVLGEKGARSNLWRTAFDGALGWEAHLLGARLDSLRVVEGERILDLQFSNECRLRVELFSARPNWTLQIADQTLSWRKVAAAIVAPAASELGEARTATGPGTSASGRGGTFTVREFGSGDWMLGAYQHYLQLRQESLITQQLTRAQTLLQSRLMHLMKIRRQLNESLEESRKAEQLKVKGEWLKSVLHQHPQKITSKKIVVSIEDENGPRDVSIDVDPKLTLSENAKQIFTKYKKLLRTQGEVETRMQGIEAESKKLTASIAKLRGFVRASGGGDFDQEYARLALLLAEIGVAETDKEDSRRVKEKKQEKKWTATGVRKFVSAEGLPIWIGRNHSENEELVIRLARGNDMWMHLKGRPGAHAVIQLSGGRSASLETLLDAATLVVYYSDHDSPESGAKVEVDYTFRKYVKRVSGGGSKAKGSGSPFLVTYTQNKTLMVKVDRERLDRLMKGSTSA